MRLLKCQKSLQMELFSFISGQFLARGGRRETLELYLLSLIIRPRVAGAFLRSHLLLIKLIIQSATIFLQIFKTSLNPTCKSQGAELFRECSRPPTCHMSGVRCHMSRVFSLNLFLLLFFGQSGGASQWRVCYQLGLPRLVLSCSNNI